MKKDRLYLIHMQECVTKIEAYTASGREAFLSNGKTQDAVVRNLQVLAESANRLSEDAKARAPHVDWRGIKGFRNVLVHDYLGIDTERIWQVVEKRLPELKRAIDQLQRESELNE